MAWTTDYNGAFFLSLATMFFGALALCMKYSFMSKCSKVKFCCGLINIDREVELETNIEDKKNNNSESENKEDGNPENKI